MGTEERNHDAHHDGSPDGDGYSSLDRTCFCRATPRRRRHQRDVRRDPVGDPTACLAVGTAEGDEEGCADVTDTFSLADDLSSASLAPTAFDLYVQVCEGKACDSVYSRTVTVEATWAAADAGQRVHERLFGGGGADDPCATVVVVTGLFQPATGTLIVDGAAAEGTGDLQALAEVTRRTCR